MDSLEKILKLEVAVGFGRARFPMSRGSFRYVEKLEWKRTLSADGPRAVNGGYEWTLKDPVTGERGRLSLTKWRDGVWRLKPELEALGANRYWFEFPAAEDEHIYGCGETFSEFDLKGQRVRIWVAEHQNAKRIGAKMIREKLLGPRPQRKLPFEKYESYYVQPTFVSSKRYFVHSTSSAYAEFDLSLIHI